jgi:hypothetical protein
MPVALPQSVKRVLEDKAYGHVVTFNPNGQPQVTMVWMDVEGNEALKRLIVRVKVDRLGGIAPKMRPWA